jgi:hypothetical protein
MTGNARGSMWNRWDPHIHPPGTVLNNQYGIDGWTQFFDRIEASDPRIRALGITDYYSVDVYEDVLAKKKAGLLSSVDLIFPNVEMRYGIGTGSGSPINVHLLISPDDFNHVEEIRRFLRAFTFEAYGEVFRCYRADLIKLGRAHDKRVQDDAAALAAGTNQFKINPDQMRAEWKRSTWVQENVLIAVAGGSNDGTSGLQVDGSLSALRKEIERSAQIILSSQPKQRQFWLGHGAASVERLTPTEEAASHVCTAATRTDRARWVFPILVGAAGSRAISALRPFAKPVWNRRTGPGASTRGAAVASHHDSQCVEGTMA